MPLASPPRWSPRAPPPPREPSPLRVASPPPVQRLERWSHSPGDPGASPDPNAPVGTVMPPAQGGGVRPERAPIVVPKPGQLDVHPISGPDPDRDGDRPSRRRVHRLHERRRALQHPRLDRRQSGTRPFEITLREGHGPGQTICPEHRRVQAARSSTSASCDPGTYTISDGTGGASPSAWLVA